MEREVMVDARHPLVTPLYSAFQDRLYLYLEMEYCPGGSLDNFLMYVTSGMFTVLDMLSVLVCGFDAVGGMFAEFFWVFVRLGCCTDKGFTHVQLQSYDSTDSTRRAV